MPQYKDEERGSWYCKFSYQDWTGQRRQKLKRGFPTKREAAAWERSFLEKQQGTPDMAFKTLVCLYMEDMVPRLKESTIVLKKRILERWVLPYFGERVVNGITPADVRKWQAMLLSSKREDGQPLKPAYIKRIDVELNALFNYAVRYYSLPANPHKTTGSVGKGGSRSLNFWTLDEFNRFMEVIPAPQATAMFSIFYYTGLRRGELQALTLGDIDFEKRLIHVSKTYSRRDGKDIVTSPKTIQSNRSISIPAFLRDQLKEYVGKLYGLTLNDRIFTLNRSSIRDWMIKGAKKANVPVIRVHDLRHSHVSLLIHMGFLPLLIAERIGDSVDMVNHVYGHLYPNSHTEIADRLNDLVS